MTEILEQMIEISTKEGQEKKSRQLPTGLGQERLAEGRETLPAVEVANEVIWVNKAFPELPFDLKRGEQTNLGLFLTPEQKKDKTFWQKILGKAGKSNTPKVEVRAHHSRSGILGRVIFKDKDGNLYRDVDVKGIGYTTRFAGKSEVSPVRLGIINQTMGILNIPYARHDISMSEDFLEAGIRTHRVIGLIRLKEIIDGESGEKITIEKAKTRQTLYKNDQPGIEIRAFGTTDRIEDIRDRFTSGKRLEDARLLVAQELGIRPIKFGLADYFDWFIKTTAQNLAKIHARGYVHKYLSPHNITLDARIVDLDSVTSKGEMDGATFIKEVNFDKSDITESFNILRNAHIDNNSNRKLMELTNFSDLDSLYRYFNREYDDWLAKLDPELSKSLKLKHETL